jgi:hypothetical protein
MTPKPRFETEADIEKMKFELSKLASGSYELMVMMDTINYIERNYKIMEKNNGRTNGRKN